MLHRLRCSHRARIVGSRNWRCVPLCRTVWCICVCRAPLCEPLPRVQLKQARADTAAVVVAANAARITASAAAAAAEEAVAFEARKTQRRVLLQDLAHPASAASRAGPRKRGRMDSGDDMDEGAARCESKRPRCAGTSNFGGVARKAARTAAAAAAAAAAVTAAAATAAVSAAAAASAHALLAGQAPGAARDGDE